MNRRWQGCRDTKTGCWRTHAINRRQQKKQQQNTTKDTTRRETNGTTLKYHPSPSAEIFMRARQQQAREHMFYRVSQDLPTR